MDIIKCSNPKCKKTRAKKTETGKWNAFGLTFRIERGVKKAFCSHCKAEIKLPYVLFLVRRADCMKAPARRNALGLGDEESHSILILA